MSASPWAIARRRRAGSRKTALSALCLRQDRVDLLDQRIAFDLEMDRGESQRRAEHKGNAGHHEKGREAWLGGCADGSEVWLGFAVSILRFIGDSHRARRSVTVRVRQSP